MNQGIACILLGFFLTDFILPFLQPDYSLYLFVIQNCEYGKQPLLFYWLIDSFSPKCFKDQY